MLTRGALRRRLAAERLSQTGLAETSETTVGPKLRSSDGQTENTQSSEAVSAIVPTDSVAPPQDADPSIQIRQLRAANSIAADDESRENIPVLPVNVTSGNVVSKIEAIMESILDQLLEKQDMSINVGSRRSSARRGRTNNSLQPVRFTGRSNVEATKFARVLLILQLSHSALVSGIILTRRYAKHRNIYYQHQELFKSQQIVDQLVDDIAVMLNVDRDDLNIVASAKGLVVGRLLFRFHDGSSLDVTMRDEGTLLPTTKAISSIDISTSRWMLVIEKDATFRTLASSRFWQTSLAGPGILVTAKGYPDLSTRTFLNLVQSTHPSLPIFILTDYDPDGINIFSCYRFGSDALSHESQVNDLGAIWLGVKAGHVLERQSNMLPGGASRVGTSASAKYLESILPLSIRDRKLVCRTLGRTCWREGDDAGLKKELQLMLLLNVKAEIQSLDEAGNLEHWLDREILSHLLYDYVQF